MFDNAGFKRIDKYRKNELRINLHKYVVFSDLHLGCGDIKDESVSNNIFLFNALKYYLDNDFTLILLGDIFEVALNTDIDKIKYVHDDIMWLFEQFYSNNRLIYVRGNHDMLLKEKDLQTRFDKYTKQNVPFLKGIKLYDSILLNDKILLQHGHQGYWRYSSWFNKVVIFLGQKVFKPIRENFWNSKQVYITNNTHIHNCEKIFNNYGESKNLITVCGHTHELNWQLDKTINSGSGVNLRFISCIEASDKQFMFIKWTTNVNPDYSMNLSRKELFNKIISLM